MPPARGATQLRVGVKRAQIVSIHAPRAGGNLMFPHTRGDEKVSIHAPRAGGNGMDTVSSPQGW